MLKAAAPAAGFRAREARRCDEDASPAAARAGPVSRAEPRHHTLDLLRGTAALGVAAYHFLASREIIVQSLGTFGIYIFFILSGLTMMHVYASRFSGAIASDDIVIFFWNRISRLIPLLAAVALISLALATPDIGWNRHLVARALQSFLTGTGLFALHLPGYLSTVTGGWSLGTEIVFYLMFPIICLLTARARFSQLAVAAIVLVVAQQILLAVLQHLARDEFASFWYFYTTPLMFAPFFMFGIAIFRFRLEKRRANLLAFLACTAAIGTFSMFLPIDIFVSHWAYLVLSACAAAAVLFAYHSDTPRLLIPVAAFLGNASYALYLTHPLCIPASEALSDALGLGARGGAALFLALSLGIAYGSVVFFERPVQRYLRGRMQRHALVPSRPCSVSARGDLRRGGRIS